jgi:hypothetical protein
MINKDGKTDFKYIDFEKKLTAGKTDPIVIPNVNQLAREMTSKSQIGIIIDRVLKLSPVDWIKLGLNNILSAPMLLKKDFATGIKILCELEILKSKKQKFILHNQFVDMAIAANNKKVLVYFFGLSKKYSFQPGIITYNIGPFIKYLSGIKKVPPNLVIYTPLDPTIYPINPTYEDVIDYIKTSPLTFVQV